MIKRGAFRQVWLTERWAIKLPRFDRFLEGLKFNRREIRKWKELGNTVFEYKGGNVRLCPIAFYLPFGLTVIMRRAEALPENYFKDVTRMARTGFLFHTVRVNIVDTDYIKIDTYGFLDGNLVVVDYAGCDTKLEEAVTLKHMEYRADTWGKW